MPTFSLTDHQSLWPIPQLPPPSLLSPHSQPPFQVPGLSLPLCSILYMTAKVIFLKPNLILSLSYLEPSKASPVTARQSPSSSASYLRVCIIRHCSLFLSKTSPLETPSFPLVALPSIPHPKASSSDCCSLSLQHCFPLGTVIRSSLAPQTQNRPSLEQVQTCSVIRLLGPES